MKKMIDILLIMFMVLSFAACGNSVNSTGQTVEESGTSDEETEISDVQGAKVLVVYFSATNTTKGVAENLAEGLGADIYEIVPENPYTDAKSVYRKAHLRIAE